MILIKVAPFLVLGFIAVIYLQFDDDLRPEVRQWLVEFDSRGQQKSEAYIFLNGIMAGAEDSVLDVGASRLSKFRTAESDNVFDNLVFDGLPEWDEVYPKSKHLKKPSNSDSLYCRLSAEGCLSGILKASDRWGGELKRHQEIYNRYLTFIDYVEFVTLTKPYSLRVPLPDYQYLVYGNRLRFIESLQLIEAEAYQKAMVLLMADIEKLRVQLTVADNLIHKMIFTRLISNNLDAIAYIAQKSNSVVEAGIPNLSQIEMNFELPMMYELATMYPLLKEMDRHPDFFGKSENMPSWLERTIYKPNMTINEIFSGYKKFVDLAKLPASQFANLTPEEEAEVERNFSLRNLRGGVLADVAGLDFGQYIARVHDLNAKITLVNYLLAGQKGKLINPYYPDKQYQAITTSKFCFDGPYPDTRHLRCGGLILKKGEG